ncbi:TetR/AcrR family transcriptional regulator [Mycobacterium sp. Lab-001]|uniref:TetR/AcrR family transcriptional regulator n=1 Tax=Mycobacterium sp. Lab-001 TaxID=3410136 RepID=UPI003D167B71
MTSAPAGQGDRDPAGSPSMVRIRASALRLFAAQGTSATTLRAIAAAAEVSLGLVQHYFATKADLISAVDAHVLEVVGGVMAQPVSDPPADSVAEMGRRVTALLIQQPDVVDYVVDALVSGRALGTLVFDALAALGADRWKELDDLGQTRPDLDRLWAPLHPLVLVLGALVLRPHLDRHLPQPFSTPTQMRRWEESVTALLREGHLRTSGPGGASTESSGCTSP